jgi:hypothetical protein
MTPKTRDSLTGPPLSSLAWSGENGAEVSALSTAFNLIGSRSGRDVAHEAVNDRSSGVGAFPAASRSMHTRLSLLRSLVVVAALAGCNPPAASTDAGAADANVHDAYLPPDAGDPPLVPDLVCPGGPSCADSTDTQLQAGAAAVTITPVLADYETYTDVNGNGEFDPGDTFEDTNGNGVLDTIWMAGFGTGRGAMGVNDDQWARALALRVGDTTMVFLVLDCVGYFIDEMDLIREAVPAALEVDYVIVSATHVHEAADTIGIWGGEDLETGRNDQYMAYIRERAGMAIEQAVAALEPSNLDTTSVFLRDVDTDGGDATTGVGDVARYVGDNRDPAIFDDQIRLMRFVAVDGEGSTTGSDTISTLINYAGHPEYAGSDNVLLSSDYVNWLRDAVENGVDGPGTPAEHREGVGGVAVFINGPLGVQIGPNRVHLEAWDGTPVEEDTLLASQTVGEQLGWHILGALRGGAPLMTLDGNDVPIGFRRARFFLKVENTRYQIAFRQGLFDRDVFHYDPEIPINTRLGVNVPDVETEIAVIDIGPAQMITAPGELDPLLFVGTSGRRAFTPDGMVPVDPTRENPPDLSMSTGPYLLDLARADARAADQVWILGLTNDFLGYFVPPFDFEIDPSMTYLIEAPGAHYEETNSLGPSCWPRLLGKYEELLAFTP